jgi:hypothetical protein
MDFKTLNSSTNSINQTFKKNQAVTSPPLGIVPVGRVIVVSDLILVHAIEHERRQRSEDPCKTRTPNEITPINRTPKLAREKKRWGLLPES